jgi:hypothetical protein
MEALAGLATAADVAAKASVNGRSFWRRLDERRVPFIAAPLLRLGSKKVTE